MAKPYWFGVTYTFDCPQCSKVSSEKVAVNSDTNEPEKVNAALKRERLFCQNCSAPLQGKAKVMVNVQPGTLEQLRKADFPLPEDLAQGKDE
jgi:hypothetical protein